MPKVKKYTEAELIERIVEAVDENRRNHFIIINYILNKNSHPLPRGIDHDKLLDDIQDFESYLLR